MVIDFEKNAEAHLEGFKGWTGKGARASLVRGCKIACGYMNIV